MKKIATFFSLFALAALILSSCTKVKPVTMDGLSFEVLQDAKVNDIETGTPIMEMTLVEQTNSIAGFYILKEQVVPKVAMAEMTQTLPVLWGSSISDVEFSDIESDKFQTYESQKMSLTAKIQGVDAKGEVTMFNANKCSYMIFVLWSQGNKDQIDKVIKSVVVSMPVENMNLSLEQRMEENVKSESRNLPFYVAEGLIFNEANVDAQAVNYSYVMEDAADYSAEDLAQMESDTSVALVDEIASNEKPLIEEWFAAGKSINYIYYGPGDELLFKIEVNKEKIAAKK